jgi:hypothetical protein
MGYRKSEQFRTENGFETFLTLIFILKQIKLPQLLPRLRISLIRIKIRFFSNFWKFTKNKFIKILF